MKRLLIALLVAVFAAPAFADKAFVPLSATDGILITSTGPVSVERINIQSIGVVTPGPGPVVPGPIIPVPTGTLAEVMATATAAVQDANKEANAKEIAFTIGLVSQYIPKGKEAKVSDITSLLKTMADASMGADAAKWSTWWATVDAATKSMTVEQYRAALGVVQSSLTDNMQFASGQFAGVENYGLDIERLMKILEFVMKYLPMILALFA